MKLLIIGSPQSAESQLLKQEADKRNHSIEIIPLSKLIFRGGKNLSIVAPNGSDIGNFDAVLFRAINRHITEAKIVAQYMKSKKRAVVDEILADGDYYFHKFFMHYRLWLKNIPQPATFYALNLEGIEEIVQKIKSPLIVKPVKGMHGRGVFRFDSKKEILDFFKEPEKKRLGHYLIQEWYPAKRYYRTLVLGNKVLGVMERISLLCRNRPKIPLDQKSKRAELSPALKKLSLKTAKALRIELAGLDIMPDEKGKLRILEINRSPKFKRFIQTTGVNAAEEIIKYIEEKIKKS